MRDPQIPRLSDPKTVDSPMSQLTFLYYQFSNYYQFLSKTRKSFVKNIPPSAFLSAYFEMLAAAFRLKTYRKFCHSDI